MKSSRIASALLCALIAASCSGPVARIDGSIADASACSVIVKMLDVNTEKVLDTLTTDLGGKFSYKMEMTEGQPQFVYLYMGDERISSLLLEAGDAVKVSVDGQGTCTIEGSEESVLLQENERKFAQFLSQMASTDDSKELTKTYVNYYREATKYVLSHTHSMTVIPVLFQSVNPDFPVFSQQTDALQFRAIADSLKSVYPESGYVKALDAEATRREKIMKLNSQLDMATVASFPDIRSKDINGKDAALSEVDAKVVLIHFWTASDAASKIMNLDSLKPLYEKYHAKGLEIFQVSLDTDKALWASVVKGQELPWINVNDGLGTASQAVMLYNVSTLPQSFLLVNGELYDKPLSGDVALRNVLDSVLK